MKTIVARSFLGRWLKLAWAIGVVFGGKALIEIGRDGFEPSALTGNPAAMNGPDGQNFTPLMWAAIADDPRDFDLLMATGECDPEAVSFNGWTALMMAAYRDHVDVIRRLARAGADVNRRTCRGAAIHVAAMGGNIRAISVLAELGADIDAVDGAGTTPLIRLAGCPNSAEAARRLLELGADVDVADRAGETALQRAERESDKELVGVLRAVGAHR